MNLDARGQDGSITEYRHYNLITGLANLDESLVIDYLSGVPRRRYSIGFNILLVVYVSKGTSTKRRGITIYGSIHETLMRGMTNPWQPVNLR